MTSSASACADGPEDLLADLHRLTRLVRIAQRGTWFPLCVLAAAFLLATPLSPLRAPSQRPVPDGCRRPGDLAHVHPGGPGLLARGAGAGLRAGRGLLHHASPAPRVGSRVAPYVVAGVALAAVLTAASLLRAVHPPALPAAGSAGFAQPHRGVLTCVTPATAVGLGLPVLAWVEANRALLAFSAGFLAIALVQAGHVIHSGSRWYFLPSLVLPAVLLLLGGALLAAMRPATAPPPQ